MPCLVLTVASIVFGASLLGIILAFMDKLEVPPIVSFTLSLIAVVSYFATKDENIIMPFTFVSFLALIVELIASADF